MVLSMVTISPPLSLPFRVSVEIEPIDRGFGLLEAYIVEPCEARAVDVLDLVVGDEEVLLPPHEDKVSLVEGLVVKVVRVEVLCVGDEGVEFALRENEENQSENRS